MVEMVRAYDHQLPKLNVEGSDPFGRSRRFQRARRLPASQNQFGVCQDAESDMVPPYKGRNTLEYALDSHSADWELPL
jgi:hypothetical protein